MSVTTITPTEPVTVVVATRDRPELLRATLASIAAQDHEGIITSVVVYDQSEPDLSLTVDGGSRPVQVIPNVQTQGLAGARNTGINAATTELVAFCDDDDTWRPSKIRRQVEVLMGDQDAAVVTTGITVHYADAVIDRVLDMSEVRFPDLLRSRLVELHPSSYLLRRSALDVVGLVDEAIPGGYAEDYEFLLRIARSRRILNVQESLVDVLWHQKSFFTARWETIATALDWLLERYPEFDDEPAGKARITGQIAFANAASGHRRDSLARVGETIRLRPLEPRSYLALAVASGVVGPDRVLKTLHRFGRGI